MPHMPQTIRQTAETAANEGLAAALVLLLGQRSPVIGSFASQVLEPLQQQGFFDRPEQAITLRAANLQRQGYIDVKSIPIPATNRPSKTRNLRSYQLAHQGHGLLRALYEDQMGDELQIPRSIIKTSINTLEKRSRRNIEQYGAEFVTPENQENTFNPFEVCIALDVHPGVTFQNLLLLPGLKGLMAHQIDLSYALGVLARSGVLEITETQLPGGPYVAATHTSLGFRLNPFGTKCLEEISREFRPSGIDIVNHTRELLRNSEFYDGKPREVAPVSAPPSA